MVDRDRPRRRADDGNADIFMSADTVHPSRAGYENLELRLRDALGPIRV